MAAVLETAARYLPEDPATLSLDEVKRRAKQCRACPLYKLGTQTVFGEGSPNAKIVLVGEQPGDKEDLADRPFVGPAGKLLDQALAAAGIDRRLTYVTNAVKHFKWKPVLKRRQHQKPVLREIRACKPWLEAELALLKPQLVIALGATAAQSLMGPTFASPSRAASRMRFRGRMRSSPPFIPPRSFAARRKIAKKTSPRSSPTCEKPRTSWSARL